MYYYFYKITNNINGKYYYGVHHTDNLDDEYMGSGVLLKQAYTKYGQENFTKEIIKYFDTSEEMYDYEKQIVNEDLTKDNNCYNIALGGHGNCLAGLSDEYMQRYKENMSVSIKNLYIRRPEMHDIMSNATKGVKNGMYGKRHTEESKQKMSENRKGKGPKHLTQEWRNKISAAHKGKKKNYDVWNKGKRGIYSEETLKKISEAATGRKKSQETIEKTRLKMIGQKRSEETRQRMSEAAKKVWAKRKEKK